MRRQIGEHEGRYDLIPGCPAQAYIRHDESGDRTITPDDYAAEIAAAHRERPHTRFAVYEHALSSDRAWFRFTLKWTNPGNGETRTRAGIQLYRIEGGKLSEMWLTLLKTGFGVAGRRRAGVLDKQVLRLRCVLVWDWFLTVGTATSAPSDLKADEAAISSRLHKWPAAFNARDIAGTCDLFAPNLISTVPGASDGGRDAVCARLAAFAGKA